MHLEAVNSVGEPRSRAGGLQSTVPQSLRQLDMLIVKPDAGQNAVPTVSVPGQMRCK